MQNGKESRIVFADVIYLENNKESTKRLLLSASSKANVNTKPKLCEDSTVQSASHARAPELHLTRTRGACALQTAPRTEAKEDWEGWREKPSPCTGRLSISKMPKFSKAMGRFSATQLESQHPRQEEKDGAEFGCYSSWAGINSDQSVITSGCKRNHTENG